MRAIRIDGLTKKTMMNKWIPIYTLPTNQFRVTFTSQSRRMLMKSYLQVALPEQSALVKLSITLLPSLQFTTVTPLSTRSTTWTWDTSQSWFHPQRTVALVSTQFMSSMNLLAVLIRTIPWRYTRSITMQFMMQTRPAVRSIWTVSNPVALPTLHSRVWTIGIAPLWTTRLRLKRNKTSKILR